MTTGVVACDFDPGERDRLLDVATRLGEEIWQRRVVAKGEALTWLRPPSDSRREAGAEIRVDPFLYDGVAGVALFFAALETFHRDGRNLERCLCSLHALRKLLAGVVADRERSRNPALGVGGVIGLGSFVYVLSQAARLLGEEQLLTEARQLLPLFTPERIARDVQFDLLYGAAGAILALLACDEAACSGADSLSLQLACRCADHLLRSQRTAEGGGPRAWTTVPGMPQLGNLNHGASGIGYALLQLYRRTREPALLIAAREGLAYESQFFVPGRGNWRDLRSADQERFERSWCSGAAGMAAARYAMHDLLADPRLYGEAEAGMETVRLSALSETDHLCCGNCGAAEALLSAAMIQGSVTLAMAALGRVRAMLARAASKGYFSFRHPPRSSAFDPTFFTGAAGLGYTCLRLLRPASLPSVLLLEPVPPG